MITRPTPPRGPAGLSVETLLTEAAKMLSEHAPTVEQCAVCGLALTGLEQHECDPEQRVHDGIQAARMRFLTPPADTRKRATGYGIR